MPKRMTLTAELAAEYQQLFASCTITPYRLAAVKYLVRRITQQRRRYLLVERASTVPWQVISVIHALEANLRLNRHLHNGDPLHSRTVHVPANRPLGEPPFTWEASAIDALHYTGLANWQDWSIAGTLFKLEAYNGWGYRRYHQHVLSPYLWSFSNHYTQGKYASDGKFDPNLVSKQCGAALLLKELLSNTADQPSNALSNQAFEFNSKFNIQNPTLLLQPYPGRTIKPGERQRSIVKTIQRRLNTLGVKPTLLIDGRLGPLTTQAIMWFQASTHPDGALLKVDGQVGHKTWAELFKVKH